MLENFKNNQSIKRRRLVPAAFVLTLVLIFAGAVVFFDGLGSGEPSPSYVSETSSVVATAASGLAAIATPTPEPPPAATAGPIAPGTPPTPIPPPAVTRLQIPRIGIDARIVSLGIDSDGTMQAPSRPMDVAWYRFSGRPGQPGNVVMAGHVSFAGFGPAVFARLTDLRAGDEILLETPDGARFAYHVLTVSAHEDLPDEVARAVGPTSTEVVTLITCTGTFDPATRLYDRRLVVRAARS